MNLTRRQFLKFIAAGAASLAIPIPAFSSTRKPYVNKGEVVSYIGHCPGGFIGGRVVVNINKWDKIGYPVSLHTNTYPPKTVIYYDFDLADFNRELPDRFWRNHQNRKRYNNVHTYLRVKRFGETIEEAISHLNFATGGIIG